MDQDENKAHEIDRRGIKQKNPIGHGLCVIAWATGVTVVTARSEIRRPDK